MFIRIFVPVFIFILLPPIHQKGFSFIITHSNMCDHFQYVAVCGKNCKMHNYIYIQLKGEILRLNWLLDKEKTDNFQCTQYATFERQA